MEATFYLGKEGGGVVSELPTSNNYLNIDQILRILRSDMQMSGSLKLPKLCGSQPTTPLQRSEAGKTLVGMHQKNRK